MNGNDTGGARLSSREILSIIFRRKVPIVICAVAVAAATLTAASRTTSVYEATAKVLLKRSGASLLAVTWTPFYQLEEELNTEVEIINTPFVLDRAVEILRQRAVYIRTQSGDTVITREPTVDDLSWGLSAIPVEMSNIIEITVTGADPEFVAPAANAVADAYVERRLEVRTTREVDDFFQEQIALVEGRLLHLQQQELQLRKEGEIYDLEWQYQVAIGRRSELSKDLAKVRSERIAQERKIDLVERRMAEDPDLLIPFANLERYKVGGEMLTQYWLLRNERDEKAASLTETNAEVVMLDRQIASMEQRFREETQRILREMKFHLEDLRVEEVAIQLGVDDISRQLSRTPEVVAQIDHLQKKVAATYEHYDRLMEKVLETMVSDIDDIRVANAKVISPATLQLTQAGKMQMVYVAFSIVLGITLGIGFGFLIESLDHSVKSASDVEDELGVRLLGSVPESRGLTRVTRRVDDIFNRHS
jgi:succinoglycan biosynthesis transport protein ExoP